MKTAVVWLICAVLSTALADLTHAVDADNGERMARRWCAACHVVAPDQMHGNTQAPPFSEIAKKPDFDAAKLALSCCCRIRGCRT